MLELKLAIQLRSLHLPFGKALHTAARLGARGVEIEARGELHPAEVSHTAVRHVRKRLADLGLHVTAVGFPTRRGYDTTDELDRRVSATKKALELAHGLGAPIVVNSIGRVPSDENSPPWRLLVEVLTDLGHYGQRVGATLAALTGSESGADLKRLLQALPLGFLLVNLDPASLVSAGFSSREAVAALGPAIAQVHVRDAVRDAGGGQAQEVPLGQGSVDFPALLGALEEQGYQGYLTLKRNWSDDPVHDLSAAVEYLRSLWQ